MARERMVTRTVDITVAEVMCLNVTTAQVSVDTFEISGLVTEEKDILKRVQAMVSEEIKAVHVQATSTKEILYGMLEEDFIKMAKVLPPRTTKQGE